MSLSKNIYKLLLLAGDGIGTEVMAETVKILKLIENKTDLKFEITEALIGGIAIDNEGVSVSDKTLKIAEESDFVLLGAVGGPKWDNLSTDKRPESGLLKIRKYLNLYANLRPIKVFNELIDSSPIKREYIENLDLMIIRELVGGLYFGEPKGIDILDNGQKYGYNTLGYKESEIERILKIAFEIAQKRNKKVCSVDKANVLVSMKLWRETAIKMHEKYDDIELSHMYVDAMAMELVKAPKKYDVIVTENMFGDILSDLGSQLTGSIGMLASASLGELNGKKTALYEPVHGSAPDIMGKQLANPIAMILCLSMAFKYSCDNQILSEKIETAVKQVLAKGYRTKDIANGKDSVTTSEIGNLIGNELSTLL